MATGGSQATDSAAMQQMVAEVQQLRQEMSTWATSLKVDYHAGSAAEAMDLRTDLKSKASL